VFITGAAGMVGRAVRQFCESQADTVFPYDHQALDIANREQVQRVMDVTKPDAVINCAAWTDVDGCEFDSRRAFAVNAEGPENLALASRNVDAAFVTISTDYVFDGTKDGFYTQADQPNPLSIYGRAKLEGERRAVLGYEQSIIVRSGYIFGHGGNNFLSTVVARGRRGEKLKAIRDTYGTPTYARDLAERLRQLAAVNVPGIYHVVNSGPGASFEEFTRKAIEQIANGQTVLEGISSADIKRPAKRPNNSRLRCLRTETIGLSPLRDWEAALAEFVEEELQT
jgi:dTDP-4-dehydrorhamnose reductase